MRLVLIFASALLPVALTACGGGPGTSALPSTQSTQSSSRGSRGTLWSPSSGSYPADVLNDGVMAYYLLDDTGHGSMNALSTVNPTINEFTGVYGTNVGLGNLSLTSVVTDASAFFPGSGASSSIASVPAGPLFASALTGLTVEAWIKPASLQTTYFLPIASYGRQVQGQAWVLQINAQAHLNFWFKTSGGLAKAPPLSNDLVGSTRLSVHQTYYVVATYDGTTAKLYVNGALDGTRPAHGPIDYDGTLPQWGLGIGGALGPNSHGAQSSFNGVIDDVAVYRIALTAGQIATHYSDGRYRAPQTGASRIYVLDASTKGIDTFDASGNPSSPTISDGTGVPASVAVDGAGTIYVLYRTDGQGDTVIKSYKPDGTPTTPTLPLLGTDADVLTYNDIGDFYVGSWNYGTYNGSIATYGPAGYSDGGPNLTIPLNAPIQIAVNAVGDMYVSYVAYEDDSSVRSYPRYEGAPAPTFDFPGVTFPGGVAVDATGKIYIAIASTNKLVTYNPDGSAATPTITSGLNNPETVAVDALGKIFVENGANNTITTYKADGSQTTPTIRLSSSQGGMAVH